MSANWFSVSKATLIDILTKLTAVFDTKADASHSHTKNDITDFPTLGTAAAKDVPSSGNATSSQVVMGNDTRLSDSRPASDVYAWAKTATKPTYTASEVGAIASTLKGANNGVAELDSSGKVPSSQLPSYVDDVIEGYYNSSTDRFYEESTFTTVIPPESGKSWVDIPSNKSYRWTGSVYTRVDEGVQLGETSSTAYRGDRGKTAYEHSQLTSGNPHNVSKSDVGLGNVGNFKAVSTVASQGLTDTEKSNARANIGAGTSNFSGSYNDLSNKPSSFTPSSHTHGNIQNGGTLQTNDVAIANGDKLVVTDSSDSSKIARASIAFDGSTATKCLTQKGTWENFTNNAGTVTSVKVGSTSYSPASGVVSLPAYPTTAEKLSTARNIALNANFSGGANFDGSANITIDSDFYSCAVNSGNKANYPWHRIAYCSGKTGQYTDVEAVFDISQTFEGGGYGRIKVTLRTNSNGGAVSVGARWIYRVGFDQDLVKIAYWGTTGQSVYADIFFRCGTYARISIQQVRGKRAWTLVNSNEVNDTTASDPKTSTECWATIEAAGTALHNQAYTNIVAGWDAGTVNYAKVAEKVYDVNGSNLTTFAYSKAGLATGDYSWMAAWNGYELRAVDKKQFVRVTNSNNFNQADNYSVNDLAKEHFAMAMFNNATDNPQGAKKWCHGISMAWGNVNTSWVSQIALGVEGSNGLWYRTTQGTVVGAAWKRVWDSSNLTNLNQLTNGPGYITGITKSMVTSALGYTPPTSDTNNAVTQTGSDSSANAYEVLFSATADNTDRTEGARKSSKMTFHPVNAQLKIYAGNNSTKLFFEAYGNGTDTGTASQAGLVALGNSTATGTSGSRHGVLKLYSKQSYYSEILTADTYTANRTFTLPDKTGTIALTSDIVDSKVTQTVSDSSTYNSGYKLLFSATADSTTRTEEARKSSKLMFNPYAGRLFIHNAGDKGCFTLDAEAYTVSTSATAAMLTIGNNTASGTAGNRFGRIRLYSRKSGYVDLEAADNTSKYTATLQAKTGTIALTSDVTADTRPSTTAEPIACNTSSSYPYVAVQVPPGATAGKVISIARLGINDVTYNQNLVMSTSSTTGAKLAYFVLNASDCGAWNGIAYINWTY